MPGEETAEERFLRNSSNNHLERLQTLHRNEWQIAIVLWTAVAGLGLIVFTNLDKVAGMIAHYPAALVAAAYITCAAYLFGFCKTNYKSLTTERNRYQYFQNELAKHVAAYKPQYLIYAKDADHLPQNKVAGDWDFAKSQVWGFKALSTTFLCSGVYFSSIAASIHRENIGVANMTVWYWLTLAVGAALPLFGAACAFSGQVRLCIFNLGNV